MSWKPEMNMVEKKHPLPLTPAIEKWTNYKNSSRRGIKHKGTASTAGPLHKLLISSLIRGIRMGGISKLDWLIKLEKSCRPTPCTSYKCYWFQFERG